MYTHIHVYKQITTVIDCLYTVERTIYIVLSNEQ